MKVYVSFSGGKDSQACLIHAVKKFGTQVKAVFCDTGFESPITLEFIKVNCDLLGVELINLRSKKYKSFYDLAKKKKRFPSVMSRFCTSELKVKPMVDFILDEIQDHSIIIQGIRADESTSRSKMSETCNYFHYYLHPYNQQGRKLNYRKKDVLKHINSYSTEIERPFFYSSGQDVIDYIINEGYLPNPLYKMGFKRVGCFPCIMCSMSELKALAIHFPDRFHEIAAKEKEYQSTFFRPDKIPDHARSGEYTTMLDVFKYVTSTDNQLDMFNTNPISCSSFYGLCE